MKIKTNVKIMIALGIMLLLALVLNMNTVKATEVDEAYIQSILDMIPNTMELDIQEVEYEKARDNIFNKIEKILNENNIKYVKNNNELELDNTYKLSVTNIFVFDSEYFHKTNISVTDKQNYSNSKSKQINIKYSNTNKYNKRDEQSIKNLNLPTPRYIETDIKYITGLTEEKAYETAINEVVNYYNNIINDKSITVKAISNAWGYSDLNFISMEGSMHIGIFKNGILYSSINLGCMYTIPTINAPSSVNDNDINNYVVSTIKTYNKKFAEGITKIEKGINGLDDRYYKDIEDGYTITSSNLTRRTCNKFNYNKKRRCTRY